MDPLEAIWTPSKLYGPTQSYMDMLEAIWTRSKLYGPPQSYMDLLEDIWTRSKLYGPAQNYIDPLKAIYTHSFFTSTLDRGEWTTSNPGCFTPGRRDRQTDTTTGGQMDPTAELNAWENLIPAGNQIMVHWLSGM
jgi:hypothetical protein